MKPRVSVVANGRSVGSATRCRRVIVGPGVNQPEFFPGYGGFVGWESVTRLRSGTWLVAFSAGYWHVSVPTPSPQIPEEKWKQYRRLGIPEIYAPTGGRLMICRSTDEGMAWSRPETLIDTPFDDRHPNFCELDDGTILCSFYVYPCETRPLYRGVVIRSCDGGETWDDPRFLLEGAIHAPPVQLKDGSVMVTAYPAKKEADVPGGLLKGPPRKAIFLRSIDSGDTWSVVSEAQTDHDLVETAIAQLDDGRIVCVARAEGDVFWSDDNANTWTPPCPMGVGLFAPGLIPLRDGTLVCISGSNARKSPDSLWGLQCMFSVDRGETWRVPAPDRGFSIDTDAYGYGKGVELPDGSIYVVYIKTSGTSREDAATNAVLGVRFRILPDKDGVEILPAVQ